MKAVGIRELKAQLSRHLKAVGAGASLAVTDRGRVIATINPAGGAPARPELEWASRVVAAGTASWSGGKPRGMTDAVRPSSKASVSGAVLENRE